MIETLAACLLISAQINHLPIMVLRAIHDVEGGAIGTVSHNKNGTEDFGPLQVNSAWLPTIAVATGESPGTVRNRLISDACYNATTAGAILVGYLQEAHGDLWQAIGYYHSHRLVEGARYQLKVGAAAARQALKERSPTCSAKKSQSAPCSTPLEGSSQTGGTPLVPTPTALPQRAGAVNRRTEGPQSGNRPGRLTGTSTVALALIPGVCCEPFRGATFGYRIH